MKRITIFAALVLSFFAPAFTQEYILPPYKGTSVNLENNMGTLHIMSLSNGFTIFVKEDSNSALIHTQFVCKAGTSSQSASNAGFFKLYSSLFAKSAASGGTDIFKSIEPESSCNADSATYTANCTPNDLEELVKAFSVCAIQPLFSDDDIQKEYEKLKKEVQDYASGTTGFINSAIDSRVFGEEPWKQDSGIYPALFSKYSPAEVRTVLLDIAKRYYTPDNSALFITGNISSEIAYNLAQKYFSLWDSYYAGDSSKVEGLKKSSAKQKKFVLTDSSFSSELTQVVVQYTTLPMSHADIASAAFNSSNSSYKKNELNSAVTAIRSKDYLTAASAQRSKSSRLILQALLEKPYAFSKETKPEHALPSPAEQAELFVSIARYSADFSEDEFIQAKNSIKARYLTLTGDSVECMKLLADWWALDSGMGNDGFYQRFLNVIKDVQETQKDEVCVELQNEDPFVFVLVNTDVYSKCKDDFTSKGYALVTAENASWYLDELAVQQALQSEQKKLRQAERQMSEGVDVSSLNSAEYFYYKNAPLIQTQKLSNGIPLTVKTTDDSRTAALSIAIKGGECASPKDERLLRTVMINSFARNIQTQISKMKAQNSFIGIPKILSWTEQRVSYITVECLSDDLALVFKAATDAIIYGDLEAVTADSLVREQKAQWASRIIGLGNQLNFNALKYLYRGTEYEALYDTEAEVLKNTTLNSLTNAYMQLLDASLYSIVVVGDVKTQEAKEMAEASFGVLKEQNPRDTYSFPKAEFKNKTRRVQLRHLYATDKTPEMAPNGVPILVPTKDFYDPVYYYFECPQDKNQRVLFNALLIELSCRIQKNLESKNIDTKCSCVQATASLEEGILRADAVLHTNVFLNAYKQALKSLEEDLTFTEESGSSGSSKKASVLYTIPKDGSSKTKAEKNCRAIKSRWISHALGGTQTNPGTAELIQQGLLEGNAALYLTNYITVENATPEVFLELLSKHFPNEPSFQVYSVDSKK